MNGGSCVLLSFSFYPVWKFMFFLISSIMSCACHLGLSFWVITLAELWNQIFRYVWSKPFVEIKIQYSKLWFRIDLSHELFSKTATQSSHRFVIENHWRECNQVMESAIGTHFTRPCSWACASHGRPPDPPGDPWSESPVSIGKTGNQPFWANEQSNWDSQRQ